MQQMTNFQRLSILLRNLSRAERVTMLHALQAERADSSNLDAHTAEILQACLRLLQKYSPAERQLLLQLIGETADLLELQRAEDAKQNTNVKILATIPQYLLTAAASTPPPFYGSLTNEVTDIVRNTRQRLDIIVPYISYSGVQIYTQGLKPGSKPGLQVRVLTQLMTHYLHQNLRGIIVLHRHFKNAGAQVEIRSPTDAQAKRTGVHALIHDKQTIGDTIAAQVTANISRAALTQGLEGGVSFEGPAVQKMREKFAWEFNLHERVDLSVLAGRLKQIQAEQRTKAAQLKKKPEPKPKRRLPWD